MQTIFQHTSFHKYHDHQGIGLFPFLLIDDMNHWLMKPSVYYPLATHLRYQWPWETGRFFALIARCHRESLVKEKRTRSGNCIRQTRFLHCVSISSLLSTLHLPITKGRGKSPVAGQTDLLAPERSIEQRGSSISYVTFVVCHTLYTQCEDMLYLDRAIACAKLASFTVFRRHHFCRICTA